jgi:enamine deaminase RidA (YjgF/YER057c/UK114 family)
MSPVQLFRQRFALGWLLTLLIAVAPSAAAAEALWEAVWLAKGNVFPDAVIVADQPLAHTAQLFPIQGRELVRPGDVAAQSFQVLQNLEFALATAQASLARAVRLNVYLARGSDADAVRKVLVTQFPAGKMPAVTMVESALAVPGALVAMDAVAVSEAWAPAGQVNHFRALSFASGNTVSHVAVQPTGRKVFVSGQAVNAETLRAASRDTLKSLGATLDYLHLGRQHIVQVKAFLKPMARVAEFEQSLTEFFADATVPPLVIVGWTNSSPVEIELIASSPAPVDQRGPLVDFTAPPHLKTSTAFSRVATFQRGRLLYTASLRGPSGQDAPTQVRESFSQLRALMQRTNGDMQNLAKTTCYLSGDPHLKAFRDIRPDYIDPKRPPASSLANVTGVATPGTAFVMDIIGVVP